MSDQQAQDKTEPKTESKTESVTESKSEPKAESDTESKTETKVGPITEPKTEHNAEPEQIKLDEKTENVFKKRGLNLTTKISEGAFGKVYLGTKGFGKEQCAVKVMDLEKCGEKFKQTFLPRELTMLTHIKHEHVIRTFDIFRAARKIYIFMEFASGGTIGSYLKKSGPLAESQSRLWFTQQCTAVQYMHSLGVCHRDIKLENILLDKDNNSKLTDFGFASEVINQQTKVLTLSSTYCGTGPYLPPEMLRKNPYNPLISDIWALGVVLFAMLNFKFPFHFKNVKKMYNEQLIRAFNYNKYAGPKLTAKVKDLLWKMLDPTPEERITFDAIFLHEWLVKIDDEQFEPTDSNSE